MLFLKFINVSSSFLPSSLSLHFFPFTTLYFPLPPPFLYYFPFPSLLYTLYYLLLSPFPLIFPSPPLLSLQISLLLTSQNFLSANLVNSADRLVYECSMAMLHSMRLISPNTRDSITQWMTSCSLLIQYNTIVHTIQKAGNVLYMYVQYKIK